MTSLFELLPPPDIRTENFFLMSSKFTLPIILTIYLFTVYVIGPAIMKNRPAFELKTILIGYNLLQVIINIVLFILTIPLWSNINLFCGPIDKSYEPKAVFLTRLAYYYFILKLFDLVETVFFLLRKKDNQVSFLHVYHHSTVLMGIWFAVRYYPGGQLIYFGVCNTFVHAIMYIYYLLSIWDPKYKTSIWWKKYLTQLQIAHQIFIWVTTGAPLFIENCTFPKPPSCAVAINGLIIIPMFFHFYFKNYVFNKKISSD